MSKPHLHGGVDLEGTMLLPLPRGPGEGHPELYESLGLRDSGSSQLTRHSSRMPSSCYIEKVVERLEI